MRNLATLARGRAQEINYSNFFSGVGASQQAKAIFKITVSGMTCLLLAFLVTELQVSCILPQTDCILNGLVFSERNEEET